ncbi:hypothetical protein V2G26_015789 [Clonostachys chloroleuca]
MNVANACIHAARQSYGVLIQRWLNGDFHVFDYFYVQYPFSAAVILAIAGNLGRESSREENDEFNLAAEFLQQLAQGGNFPAMDFYSHVQEIQSTLNMLPSDTSLQLNAGRDATAVDDVLLDPSFIDDWTYEDPVEKLSW